jgi:glycerophosphoryl diester phosphodiesterase
MPRKIMLRTLILCIVALIFAAPMTDGTFDFAFAPEAGSGFSLGASAETMGAISLVPATLEIGVGDEKRLDYSVDGTQNAAGVEWISSDPLIAAVGPGGKVTAVSEGACVMHGVSYGGQEADANVLVLPAPSMLIISPSSVRLGHGETYAVIPVISAGSRTSYTYKSSDASVAEVDENGLVHAKKRGTAKITVLTHNGVKDFLSVTVAKSPTYVRFKADSIVAYVGESVPTSVKLSSGAGAVVRYTTSDPSVARVDSKGRVTGVSAGQAVITCATYNGREDACDVVVYDPPVRIVAPEQIDAVAGVPMVFQIGAETEAGDPYPGYIDIDCADPDIACVTDGILYPLKRGETYITLTAHKVSMRIYISVGRYGDAYATRIAAHRGGAGNGTENTLAALQGAVRDGADAVEFDVRQTKDGVLVLIHDASVNRTSDSTGFVSRMTLEQLQSVNFKGQPICTLDEALSYLSGTAVSIILEMKTAGIEAACADAVTRAGMLDRTTFISFSLNALSNLRAAAPDASVGYLYAMDIKDPAAFAEIYSIDLMLPYVKLVDEDYVADLHNKGVRVGVWTVNKLSNLRAAHRAGVDYIITDRVASALAAVGR